MLLERRRTGHFENVVHEYFDIINDMHFLNAD